MPLTRSVMMMEPLVCGYVESSTTTKVNVDVLKRCMQYLDTNMLSERIVQGLVRAACMNSAWQVLNNVTSS